MAFTSKISNIIKGKVGSAVSGAISGTIGQALSLASQGQSTKLAARLLSKSPLEIGSVGPTSHMAENPYQYGTVYYPQETSNLGDGHYVIFDILTSKQSKFQTSTFDNGVLSDAKANFVGEPYKFGGDLFGNVSGRRQGTFNNRIKNIKSRGITQTNRVRGVNSGLFRYAESNHTYINDSILLYMPAEGMKFNYQQIMRHLIQDLLEM
jgi:hypothetical protein